MIITVIVFLLFLVCLFFTGVAMYGSYLSGIYEFGALKPDHPRLPFATRMVEQCGSLKKFQSSAKTGIEIFFPLAVLFGYIFFSRL